MALATQNREVLILVEGNRDSFIQEAVSELALERRRRCRHQKEEHILGCRNGKGRKRSIDYEFTV